MYEGEFQEGKYHGQGTLTFPDGGKYEGEWKEGVRHGQGTETLPDGGKYEGEWKEGKEHRQGTLTSPDGKKYVGEGKEGVIHGQGTDGFNMNQFIISFYEKLIQFGYVFFPVFGFIFSFLIFDPIKDHLNKGTAIIIVIIVIIICFFISGLIFGFLLTFLEIFNLTKEEGKKISYINDKLEIIINELESLKGKDQDIEEGKNK